MNGIINFKKNVDFFLSILYIDFLCEVFSNEPQPYTRCFVLIIVQNGLADSLWPGTAGALVPGYKGPGRGGQAG